jgi:SAM-dependent methyltransferase
MFGCPAGQGILCMSEQPALFGPLRLTFDTQDQYRAYIEANEQGLGQIWTWHNTLGNRPEPFQLLGICDLCAQVTPFRNTPVKLADGAEREFEVPWWISMVCHCGMSMLDRAVLRALLDGGRLGERIYHVGHHSQFRWWLSERMPDVTTSQYEKGRQPGEIVDRIRYEDLVDLSFEDGQFDCIICMEVLEHIPDYRTALREMARVLRSDGRALLTFPWLGADYYEHRVRAEVLPDGSINHVLPPEYHEDPANKVLGILSLRSFGWKILDELREAGFVRASASFFFGPLHGYMTLVNPVIVAIR